MKTSNEEAHIECSRDGQSKSNEEKIISSNEHSITTCTRNNGDKNCHAENSNMLPVKPAMDMQSNRPVVLIQNKMTKKSKIVPKEDQGTINL